MLSVKANNLLEKRVDGPFIETFGHALTYLVRVKRDSKKSSSTKLIGSDGKVWRMSSLKLVIEPDKADIRVTPLPDGARSIEFSGTEEQLRPFLKSQGLGQHFESLMAKTQRKSEPSPELHLGMQPIRSDTLSAAAWTSVALFAAHMARIRIPAWSDFVRSPPPSGNVLAPGARFAPGAVTVSEQDFGPIAHGVALWHSQEANELRGYVQTFGGIGMMVRLAKDWTQPIRHAYFVNPQSGEQGTPSFTVNDEANVYEELRTTPVQRDVENTLKRIADAIQNGGFGATRIVVE
jgi:hypothetical protein